MKCSRILILLGFVVSFSNSSLAQTECNDFYFEGKVYQTVQIGNQCWMQENLDIGTMINGNVSQTDNNLIEKYCYQNDPLNCDTYGALYQWDELMNYSSTQNQGICPGGWHIPTNSDWGLLLSNFPFSSASDSLLQSGPNAFNAILTGYGNGNGGFYFKDVNGFYYTSTQVGGSAYRKVINGSGIVGSVLSDTYNAYAVRCVKNSLTEVVPFAISFLATHVSCNGGSDGSINLQVSGAVAPTFTWSNGATTEDIENLAAGTYTVTVTEGTQTLIESVEITQPAVLQANISEQSAVSCFDGDDGQLSAQVSGGTLPYSYLWSNGDGFTSINNLAAGTYSLTVSDANNCQSTVEYTLANPADQIPVQATISPVSCFGLNDGSIDLTVSGSYSFMWSNYQMNEDMNNIPAGDYSVTITDVGVSCKVMHFTVSQPAEIVINSVITNASTQGVSDGAIDVTVSGGTTPYTFNWSDGSSTEDLSGIPAGTYTLTVTDANQCQFISDNMIVTEPGIDIILATVQDISCNGANDGLISIFAQGNGMLTYHLSSTVFNSFGSFWGLSAGTYVVTITDNFGGVALTSELVISEPDPLTIDSLSMTDGCSGKNIQVFAAGGTAPYSVSLDGTNYSAGLELNDVQAGNYTLYLQDDNGCTASVPVVVDAFNPMSVTATINHNQCFGGADGAIQLSVSNGLAPFSYTWSNAETLSYVFNLAAGTYTVTVTDSKQCVVTAEYTITEPNQITLSAQTTSVTYPGGTNGSIDLTVSGGTSPYSYAWSGGQSTAQVQGLSAGSYVVTVTDNLSCAETLQVTIDENIIPVDIQYVSNPVSCFGGADGSISLSVSGGNSPYTYVWSTGASTSALQNIPAGVYSVTVTGFHGMTASATVLINEPDAMSISVASISNYNGYQASCSSCLDGYVQIVVSGGSSPYSYSWSNGYNGDFNANIGQGTYTLTVSDANSCQQTFSQIITAPAELLADVTVTSDYNGYGVSCHSATDGALAVNVSGGVSPYTYLWSTGETVSSVSNLGFGYYSVTVQDANGANTIGDVNITQPSALNVTLAKSNVTYPGGNNGEVITVVSGGVTPYSYSWSNGATTSTINGLFAGTYSVTVTDLNGCQELKETSITEEFIPLSVTISKQNVSCNGGSNGSASASVSGGTQPYQYLWSNGSTGVTINNLSAGNYSVTITDFYGITAAATSNISQPTAISPVITVLSDYNGYDVSCFSCNDGNATVVASGGVSPYTFQWSNGTNQANLFNVSAGTYFVTVQDQHGCQAVESLSLNSPSQLTASITANTDFGGYQVSCNGSSDASLTVNASGGVGPYTYIWSNGATVSQINNLAAGVYSCTVSDANLSQTTVQFSVTEPLALNVSFSVVHNECFGDQAGQVQALPSGGLSPYTFAWSTGQTTSSIAGLLAGNYNLTLSDSQGCNTVSSATVNQPDPITVQGTITHPACFGNQSGSIQITISGGTPPFSYQWSNSATSQNLTGVSAGLYSLTVVDGNCTATAEFTINQPDDIVLSIVPTNISYYGASDGSLDLTVTGGVSPYTYFWSNGASSQDIVGLPIGSYTVTVVDNNNCSASSSGVVNQPDGIYTIDDITPVSCAGDQDGAIDLTVFGTDGSYTVIWSNGENTEDISDLYSGEYVVTIVDQASNIYTDTFYVDEPDPLSMTLLATPTTCNGGNDGEVDLLISGGTPPYTYLWNNGATTLNNINLQAGTYMAFVQDANGCVQLDGINVEEPSDFVVGVDVTHCSGLGLSDGAVTLTVAGSNPPYTYYWSNSATTSSVSNLSAGTYQVIIFDANACSEWISVDIYDDPNLIVFGCTDPAAANYNPNANANDGSCYYYQDFPDWTYSVTANNHLILVSDTIEVSMNGNMIENGDFIGVFYDSLGHLACAGYLLWEGTTTAITAWGDDPQTVLKDGFASLEEIKWKVFDVSEQIVYDATPTYLSSFQDSGLFVTNGLSGLASLIAITSETQTIVLHNGWNMISTYMNPFDPSVETLFSTIENDLVIMKDGNGNSYWPQYGVNMIGSVTVGHAYQLNVISNDSLIVEGVSVSPEEVTIDLPSGWFMLGYLRHDPAAIDFILYPIINFVDIVKDGDGNIYWPQYGVNLIGDMKPGKGYAIRTNSACSLVYPSNFVVAPLNGYKSFSSPMSEEFRSDENMTLAIPLSAWDNMPPVYSMVKAYNTHGELAGTAYIQPEGLFMTLWGQDEIGQSLTGYTDGERMQLVVETPDGERSVRINNWLRGDEKYLANKISVAAQATVEESMSSNNMLNTSLFPNPANEYVNLMFDNPADATITIYNSLGEHMSTHQIHTGGHDSALRIPTEQLPPGTYLVKIYTNTNSQSKILTIVR